MGSLANSSLAKIHGKRVMDIGGCSSLGLPTKRKKIDDLIAPARDEVRADKMCANFDALRSSEEDSCAIWGTRNNAYLWNSIGEREKSTCPNNYSGVAEHMTPIPAVPLRCIPSLDAQYRGVDDLDKLNALMDRAKEYLSLSHVKISSSEDTPSKLSKGVDLTGLSESSLLFAQSVMPNNLNGSLSESMMKVEDKVSSMVQGTNASRRLKSESEGNKDEICILSEVGWNKSQPLLQASAAKMERKKKPAESSTKLTIDDGCFPVIAKEEVANCNDKHKYSKNQKDLVNLSMVDRIDPQGVKVRKILKMFEEEYAQITRERNGDVGVGRSTKYPHYEAMEHLKAGGMSFSAEKPFGHIPGVEISHEFRFRSELSIISLHRQLVSGIDYVVLDGKKFATSIVNSGRYENEVKAIDVLIYSGQGGNSKSPDKAVDQRLEKGNLALMNSMKIGYPVRVTHKRKRLVPSNTLRRTNEANFVYIYDGLFTVNNMWQERDQNGKLVFKFELHRMRGQVRTHLANAMSRKSTMPMEVCILDDISQGKEKIPVHAMNGVDDDRYSSFVYITNIAYPSWYQKIDPVGCNCIHGCSDSKPCSCVSKNGGEIPYNEKGNITRARPIVHECSPSCKCPPSCMNRVSQHGPRHQLEIFKTVDRGWGVRSRNYITSGSFICEYIGEMLKDKEAEQKINNDEYLFDIGGGRGESSNDDGFSIDAANYGNIGRFINHSCSPNLYAQEVLHDHDDKRMPHIMFFATKNIYPLHELSYDYNYKVDRVCDMDGNIKQKNCYCGARKCTGRLY